MITEVFIEGYRLDISADISSLLTFAIDDIKDFAARSTTFSKTIVLPGTANNNRIFGNIFDTGQSNDYDPTQSNVGYNFNAAKSAKCIIFQDNLQTFSGTLRLMQINKDRAGIDYEVALNGTLTGLNVALSGAHLTDLDFSAYNQQYDAAHISASWDNVPGSGVYFPLIDYGTYSVDKHNWDYQTFRPALYVKEYIDKMFAACGYRYNCDLFNTDRFKRLIVPHNQKQLLSLTTTAMNAVKNSGSSQTVLNYATSLFHTTGTWDSFIGGSFSYSGGQFTYTGTDSLVTNIDWSVGGYRYSSVAGSFTVSLRKNGVAIASTTISTFAFTVVWGWASSISSVPVVTGDVFDIHFDFVSGNDMLITFSANPATFNITSTTPAFLPVNYGQTITVNDSIPKNIRQIDFLVSIVKLFNLYVWEDMYDDRLIYIKPFVDFYTGNPQNAVDWTYKMNRDAAVQIKPMSELNSKIYEFSYKEDNDYYNDLYKKRYNQVYGSEIYDTQYEFASETNKLTIEFAATPLVGYVGEDKVYPTIFKSSNGAEETIDSVIRIMQSKKITGVTSWQLKSGLTVRGTYTSYGYAGHFDDPDNPSNDLNFGQLGELFFVLASGDLSMTQFNVYWSSYMTEVTDKDSKLVTAKFYLQPRDIFNLDFSKYVVVDGVLFRLNKISDYNATVPGDCTVELIRVINVGLTFPPVAPPPAGVYWIDSDASYILDSDSSKILIP